MQGTILALFAAATEQHEGIKRKKDQRKRGNLVTLHLNPSTTDLYRKLPLISERPQLQQWSQALISALKAFTVLVASLGSGGLPGNSCWGIPGELEFSAIAGWCVQRMEGMVLALWLNIQWLLCTTPSKTDKEGRM